MINRSEANRALAKAIAYKQCRKDRDAAIWAAKLVRLLECAGILNDDLRPFGSVESENAA